MSENHFISFALWAICTKTHLVSQRALLTPNAVLVSVPGSVGSRANKNRARSRRGCQAHAANLGEPRVNTESRQHDPQTEASSDVRGDQVLIKLPELGSQGGFVLNSDRAQRWCFCSGWVHGVFDLMYCFRPSNSASRMWVNRSEKPLLCLGVCRVLHPSLMPPGRCLQWTGDPRDRQLTWTPNPLSMPPINTVDHALQQLFPKWCHPLHFHGSSAVMWGWCGQWLRHFCIYLHFQEGPWRKE